MRGLDHGHFLRLCEIDAEGFRYGRCQHGIAIERGKLGDQDALARAQGTAGYQRAERADPGIAHTHVAARRDAEQKERGHSTDDRLLPGEQRVAAGAEWARLPARTQSPARRAGRSG